MTTNLLKEGVLTENSAGIGTVTRKMVRDRAIELALINGRSAHEASKSDWEQAKRELTGDSSMDMNDAVFDSTPESERWDPIPGSTGNKVPVTPSEDEDEEGRSDNERLVDEGMAGAEHDQRRRAIWMNDDGELLKKGDFDSVLQVRLAPREKRAREAEATAAAADARLFELQILPFHFAMFVALTPPAVVKLPPA